MDLCHFLRHVVAKLTVRFVVKGRGIVFVFKYHKMSAALVHWCLGYGGWMGIFVGTIFAIGLPKDMGYARYAIAISMPFVVGITTLLIAQASIAFSSIIMLTLKSMYSLDTMMSVVASICCSLAIALVVLGSMMAIQLGRFNRMRAALNSCETNSQPSSEEGAEEEDQEEGAEEEEDEEDNRTESDASSQSIEEEAEEVVTDVVANDGAVANPVDNAIEAPAVPVDAPVVEETVAETVEAPAVEETMEVDADVLETAKMLELMQSIDRDINKPLRSNVDMEEMD